MARTPPTPVPPPPAERRAAERHRCLRECLVRVVGAAAPGDWAGMAYNVSRAGVGLALPFPVPPGTVLEIQLQSVRKAAERYRARVARCRLQKFVWFHGCAFTERLSEADLRAWLQEAPAAALPDVSARRGSSGGPASSAAAAAP